MAEALIPGEREKAVAALRKRGLTKAELLQRLDEFRLDQHFKTATQLAHESTIEQAGVIRRLFAERLDAFKWVAALSTAAFFFVGQAVGGAGRSMAHDAALAALVSQVCFLMSVFGAALYMFRVDTRASNWHRSLFIQTSRVMMLLAGLDASADELRDALGRDDLKAANASFWEMYDAKERLGEAQKSGLVVAREGRIAGLASALCIGGLIAGLIGAALFEWSRVLFV